MLEFNDFIQVYENNLDLGICNSLINIIDQYEVEEYNLTENRELTEDISIIHNEIVKLAIKARDEYYEYVCPKLFPSSNAFEQIHIYKKIIQEENARVDVIDYNTARRYLCLTWFLNDAPGGNYQFVDQSVYPQAGKLLIYPPQWLSPYKETCTNNIPRYTLKTYLHYK